LSKDAKPTPPAEGGGTSPAGDAKKSCCPADFELSPCRIVKVKGTLQIKATELPGFPGGTYEWTTSSDKITLENEKSSTVTVKAKDNPGSGKESETINVTRTAAGCDAITKVVKITVAKITFSASPNQLYGYDNCDTPADNTDDHICVKTGDHTFLKVKIEGGAVGTDFDWACEPPAPCTPVQPGGDADFDLRLDAAAENKKTTLHARSKCPSKESFASIPVHVYKEKVVDVVVAKFDKTAAGANLRFPTADYASFAPTANDKLKEAVVKYNITNFDAANAVTPINFASGTATITFDIKAGGGADLTAIGAAMTGTGTKVRVAIVRDMKSVYFLKDPAHVGDTSVKVTAASTFFRVGNSPPLDTGANQEPLSITGLAGNTISCAALTKEHAAGATIEFPAIGWSTDPILVIEGSKGLDVAKWTVVHEAGHKALKLSDILDITDLMHATDDNTDFRLRFCGRLKSYPDGTTDKENQWELIPR